jgi:hypothetical protein
MGMVRFEMLAPAAHNMFIVTAPEPNLGTQLPASSCASRPRDPGPVFCSVPVRPGLSSQQAEVPGA